MRAVKKQNSQYTFKRRLRLCFLSKFLESIDYEKEKLPSGQRSLLTSPSRIVFSSLGKLEREKKSVSGENAFIMDWTLRPRTFC